MARPPKPTALKLLAGNPGKRKVPEEKEVEHGVAVKPKWLENDPLSSPVWDELAPSRIAIGLLTDVTAEGFAFLCRYIAEHRRNPASLTGPQISDMRALRNAFGFDPSALAKLGIGTGRRRPRTRLKN